MPFLQNIQIRTLAAPLVRSRTNAKFMKPVARDPTESSLRCYEQALRCYEQVMKVNPFCRGRPAIVHLGRRRLVTIGHTLQAGSMAERGVTGRSHRWRGKRAETLRRRSCCANSRLLQ